MLPPCKDDLVVRSDYQFRTSVLSYSYPSNDIVVNSDNKYNGQVTYTAHMNSLYLPPPMTAKQIRIIYKYGPSCRYSGFVANYFSAAEHFNGTAPIPFSFEPNVNEDVEKVSEPNLDEDVENVSEPNLNEYFENSSQMSNAHEFNYAPYVKRVQGPLLKTDMENILDLNDRALTSEFHFNSTHILTLLIDYAAAQKTTPEKFLEEIQDLVALQSRSKANSEDSAILAVGSETKPAENSEDSPAESKTEAKKLVTLSYWMIPRVNISAESSEITDSSTQRITTVPNLSTTMKEKETWEDTLEHLEKKYNISSNCLGPDSITASRLTLMFPHYLNLGQKPFVGSSYVTVRIDETLLSTVDPIQLTTTTWTTEVVTERVLEVIQETKTHTRTTNVL